MAGELQFPDGFLWGTATAGHQIEGNNVRSDWWEWEKLGKVKDGTRSGRAVDYWNRYEEDHALMEQLGYPAFRLGIEWARVEPEEGRFDEEAISRYRAILESLRRRGIKICLTLYHWVLPAWVAGKGGWLNPDALGWFLRYTERVVRELGEYPDVWVTLNEPTVPALAGHLAAEFPPEHRSYREFQTVLVKLLRAHAGAYRQIHEHVRRAPGGGPVMAGVAHAYQWIEPWHRERPRIGERLLVRLFRSISFAAWDEAIRSGYLKLPLRRAVAVPEATGTYDYAGINYYFRMSLSLDRRFFRALQGGLGSTPIPDGIERTEMGWQVYPPGFRKITLEVAEKFRKPIYILENGVADANDEMRPRYLLGHLAQLHRAITEGADVRGYFQWAFTDNFEWREGFEMKFGLVEVDHDDPDLTRKPRTSARMYSEIVAANGITEEIVRRYAPRYADHVFGERWAE